MKQRFFICKHCGNLIAMVKDTGVPVVCCGEKMHELIPARSRKPASPCARETRWRRPMPTATSTVSGKNNSHIERKPLHIRAEICSCFQNGPIKNSEW